jgi:predicted glutamine amidotransferase
MCQLLAMSCNSAAAISFSFTGFAERGGRTDHHADGWGIGFYEACGCRTFHDSAPACSSALADFVKTYPIKSRIVLAHIRKATQGATGLSNCHPFQREWLGQQWLFAHNGDLREWRAPLSGAVLPVGTTDSEHAFCWMMESLRTRFKNTQTAPQVLGTLQSDDCPSARNALPVAELGLAIAELAAECAAHGNFNIVLSNGEYLFLHCSSKLYTLTRQHPFPVAQLVDCDMRLDLNALNASTDRITIVATEPLTADEPWHALATGTTLAIKDGAIVWRHHNASTNAFPVPGECELADALVA